MVESTWSPLPLFFKVDIGVQPLFCLPHQNILFPHQSLGSSGLSHSIFISQANQSMVTEITTTPSITDTAPTCLYI